MQTSTNENIFVYHLHSYSTWLLCKPIVASNSTIWKLNHSIPYCGPNHSKEYPHIPNICSENWVSTSLFLISGIRSSRHDILSALSPYFVFCCPVYFFQFSPKLSEHPIKFLTLFQSHPLPFSFFSTCIVLGYESDLLFPPQPSPLATLCL